MATVNLEQVKKVSNFIKNLPEGGHGLNFYSFGSGKEEVVASDMYPSLHHPEAINFFFFVCLHQFGFWYGDQYGYLKPLVGLVDGKRAKGSNLLWKISMNALNNDLAVFKPERLTEIQPEYLFYKVFADDNGPIPFPDLEERFKLTRAYGKWFVENNTTPSQIVSKANGKEKSLRAFLSVMKKIDGYDQDLFEKRNLLLAMALANRPEKFLLVKDPENWAPIVDYHLLRVALRLGLVDLDKRESVKNKNRSWVSCLSEESMRQAVYAVMSDFIETSQKPMSFIDELFWSSGRYCPEMTEPECPKCVFNEVCKKRIELFQPVLRTTAY